MAGDLPWGDVAVCSGMGEVSGGCCLGVLGLLPPQGSDFSRVLLSLGDVKIKGIIISQVAL